MYIRPFIFIWWVSLLIAGCSSGSTHFGDETSEPADGDGGAAGPRRMDSPDPDPADAGWDSFFHFCEISERQCGVAGEACMDGRCYLPCQDDADCPRLQVDPGQCPFPPFAEDEDRTLVCELVDEDETDMVSVDTRCMDAEVGRVCLPSAGQPADSAGSPGRVRNDDPDPDSAAWYDFFKFCEHSEAQCGVQGERCEAGRCQLPCSDDADCPTLQVRASGCPDGAPSDDRHEALLCADVELQCEVRGDQDVCEASFADGAGERTVSLRCVQDDAGGRCAPPAR